METYGNICCKILNAFSTPVTHLKWSQKLFLLYIRVKFKLVWVTVNGYCLSWLLPVSDLDWGILGKKLHGIKWIFLNYKACNSSGSKYHLSVSSQRAREKAVKPDSERRTAFPWQSPLLLVFIMLEEAAADPDQLSLVSKLNGCKITAAQDIVLAPACNFRWQKKSKFLRPILFCNFSSLSISQFTSNYSWWLRGHGEGGPDTCVGWVSWVPQLPISPSAATPAKSSFLLKWSKPWALLYANSGSEKHQGERQHGNSYLCESCSWDFKSTTREQVRVRASFWALGDLGCAHSTVLGAVLAQSFQHIC